MFSASILLIIHLSFLFIVTILCGFTFYFFITSANKKRATYDFKTIEGQTIDVLIPTFNEGKSLLDTVNSIINQSYEGTINIRILVNSIEDSSYNFFIEKYEIKESNQGHVEFNSRVHDRAIIFHFLKANPKREKINKILPLLDSSYTAILDADHRAEKLWIKSSLNRFTDNKIVAIQSKRAPLALQNIFQLWDAIQNHLGNEVFNKYLFLKNKYSYFTGTTCLFKTDVLKSNPLPNCITEDTYWSYQQIKNGNLISFNPDFGSYEEVAPDLFSYLARRRRWAAGHHKSFIENLSIIKNFTQFFHSIFFSIPMMVLGLAYTQAIFDLKQYSNEIIIFSFLLAAFTSLFFSFLFIRKLKNFILDLIVGTLIFFPFNIIASKYLYKYFLPDKFHFLISFPYLEYIKYIHLVLILSPLLLAILFEKKFLKLNWSQKIVIICSYPLILILDLYSIILGISDFIFKQDNWYKIKRFHFFDKKILPDDLKNSLSQFGLESKKYKWPIYLILFFLALILINDLTPFHNCGKPNYLFGSKLIFQIPSPIHWDIQYQKEIIDQKLNINFKHQISNNLPVKLDIRTPSHEKSVQIKNGDIYQHLTTLGFETEKIQFILKKNNDVCVRDISYSTSVKEIINKKLYLNGEPFIIKGIVPSYSTEKVNISHIQGLSQIKKLGANTIRIYHEIYDELEMALEHNKLMIIDQTRESTWENINLNSSYDREKLIKDFKKLNESKSYVPLILSHNLGNELELRQQLSDHITLVDSMLENIQKNSYNELIGYSTFLSFKSYPSDILGINMLDSGKIYWERAFSLIENFPTAVYASELGGFVAHFENTDEFIRTLRLTEQWDKIINSTLLGAVIFQSHDNWAQPVNIGFNDPSIPEMPDDLRGLWNINNEEKPIIHFVRKMFSDISIDNLSIENNQIIFELKNIRPYKINNLKLGDKFLISELLANEKASFKLNFEENLATQYWEFNYSTHSGLDNISSVFVNIQPRKNIIIKNRDFYYKKNTPGHISGHLLKDGQLNFLIPPEWSKFKINNQIFINNKSSYSLAIPNHYKEIKGLKVKINENWKDWEDNFEDLRGEVILRIPMSAEIINNLIMIEGIGNSVIFISSKKEFTNSTSVNCHEYRECYFPIKTSDSEFIYIKFNRDSVIYVDAQYSTDNQNQIIKLTRPVLYAPMEITITN